MVPGPVTLVTGVAVCQGTERGGGFADLWDDCPLVNFPFRLTLISYSGTQTSSFPHSAAAVGRVSSGRGERGRLSLDADIIILLGLPKGPSLSARAHLILPITPRDGY